jgi:DNA-binding response OmpR family regulator
MTILVVDDHDDIREMVCTLLRAAGYSVIEAADGETAIEKFETSDCSIVVLDWLLPDVDGIEVANRIKETRYSYVIMLTAMSERKQRAEALHAGAKDYVEKPFDNEELLEAVECAAAVVTARQKFFKRLEKRGIDVEMIEEFA